MHTIRYERVLFSADIMRKHRTGTAEAEPLKDWRFATKYEVGFLISVKKFGCNKEVQKTSEKEEPII